MDSPKALYVLRWLIRDTFAQALASRAFWVMLGVTALGVLFCLGVRIDGGDGLTTPNDPFLGHPVTNKALTGPANDLGSIRLLFGLVKVSLPRDRTSGVTFLEVLLGTWVAGAAGVLLLLVWSATLVPEFLQPSSCAVLLTKPVPGWLVLTGKYLGVVLFVAVQAALFFLGTWTALGLSTGVWRAGYLAGAPLMALHFAALYAFTVLLGVLTRSTLASVLGALLFWVGCVSVNSARIAAVSLPLLAGDTPHQVAPASGVLVEAGYWLLPKPLDYLVLLEDALGASSHTATLSSLPEMAAVLRLQRFDPPFIILSTLIAAFALLTLAGAQLRRLEY